MHILQQKGLFGIRQEYHTTVPKGYVMMLIRVVSLAIISILSLSTMLMVEDQ